MWEQGNWNWDTFLDLAERFSVRNQKWGVKGFYIDEATILSTGIGILSIENGILKNNMDDARIERATTLLNTLSTGEIRFPYHELTDFQADPSYFSRGEVLFWNDGPWIYQEQWQRRAKIEDWDDGDVRIVPFPKDPEAPEHYIRGKQDAMMLVKGSSNQEAFVAWTYCALLANQDPVMIAASRERSKALYNWTDELLDVLDRLRNPNFYPLVWDFKNGIGPVASDYKESPIEELSKSVIVFGDEYSVLREENRATIIHWIDVVNAGVSG